MAAADGGQGVGDVDPDAPLHRGRDLGCRQDRRLLPVRQQRQHLPRRALPQHHRTAPLLDMVMNDRAVLAHREEEDLPPATSAIAAVKGSSALRTLAPSGTTARGTTALTRARSASVSRPTVTEVVAGHIGDHGHVAAVEAEPVLQDAGHGPSPTRRGRRPGSAGPGAAAKGPARSPVAMRGPGDRETIAGGHADPLAGRRHDVGDEAGGGRLAVGAGDRHDRHPHRLARGKR